MPRALTAVDVQKFASNEAGRLQVKNRVDHVGDLTHAADRVRGAELRICLDGVRGRLNHTERDRGACLSAPVIALSPSGLRLIWGLLPSVT